MSRLKTQYMNVEIPPEIPTVYGIPFEILGVTGHLYVQRVTAKPNDWTDFHVHVWGALTGQFWLEMSNNDSNYARVTDIVNAADLPFMFIFSAGTNGRLPPRYLRLAWSGFTSSTSSSSSSSSGAEPAALCTVYRGQAPEYDA